MAAAHASLAVEMPQVAVAGGVEDLLALKELPALLGGDFPEFR